MGKFAKIADTTSCNCIDKLAENTLDTFVRKVGESKNVKDRDFKNYIECGKIPSEPEKCEKVCGYHGVSIEIWNETSSGLLREKYLKTISFSPKLRKHLFVFKLGTGCGLVKHTPDQESGYNYFHFDFYKEDGFQASMLQPVEMIPLRTEENV